MRRMLLVAGVFVVAAGAQLFVLSEHTDRFFAWTVRPPLTAAFLGAGYWASAILELGSARRGEWARARIAMPAVLCFTTLTLAVTLRHLSRFDLDSIFGVAWLAVYAAFPVAMAAILIAQVRAAGADRPRATRLLPLTRAVLVVQAAALCAFGMALLIAPAHTAAVWPWALTPLTARAVGAWLIGIAIVAAHMALEDAPERVNVAMLSYAAFAVLQLVAVARYPGTPDWTPAGAIAYIGFLVTMLAVGLHGWLSGRRAAAVAPGSAGTSRLAH
jgi:hypothetical protein